MRNLMQTRARCLKFVAFDSNELASLPRFSHFDLEHLIQAPTIISDYA
jgi:hypothetical protein